MKLAYIVTMKCYYLKELEGLGGVGLLQEVCDYGLALTFKKAHGRSKISLFLSIDQHVALSYVFSTMSACCHAPYHDDIGLSL